MREKTPIHKADFRMFPVLLPFICLFCTVFIIGSNLASGIITGKYFWFYGAMLILNTGLFVLAFTGKPGFRLTIADGLLSLFVVSVYLSAFLFNDAIYAHTRLGLFLLLYVLYIDFRLFFSWYGNPEGLQKALIFLLILTGGIEALWGSLQLYGFAPSQHTLFLLTGTFFNPGPYAGYLAVIFPLALYAALYWREPSLYIKLGRIIAIVTIVLILLVLPAAMSRAAWIATVAGSLLVLIPYYISKTSFPVFYKEHKKSVCLTGLLVLVVCLVALPALYSLKKDSADGRSLMWKITGGIIKEHPLGVGPGNFSSAYSTSQAIYFENGRGSDAEEYIASDTDYAFNEYLQVMAEGGIPAFLFFMVGIFFIIKLLIVRKDRAILSSLAALLIFALFSYPFNVLPFLIIFVFLLASSQRGCNRYDPGKKKLPGRIITGSLLILLVSFIVLKTYPVYKAYQKWHVLKYDYFDGRYKGIVPYYRELYPVLNDSPGFLFEYAHALMKTGFYEESNEVMARAMTMSGNPYMHTISGENYQALGEYEKAEAAFLQALNIVPNRIYPYYMLAMLYNEMGLEDKTCEMARIVLNKKEKVPSPAIEKLREEVREICPQVQETLRKERKQ